MELSLLILVCIHKSYIVYLEIYVVPIGHGFSFFVHGKVMENQCRKRGGTLYDGHDLTVALHISEFSWHYCCLRQLLLRLNAEWFDVLVSAYSG